MICLIIHKSWSSRNVYSHVIEGGCGINKKHEVTLKRAEQTPKQLLTTGKVPVLEKTLLPKKADLSLPPMRIPYSAS